MVYQNVFGRKLALADRSAGKTPGSGLDDVEAKSSKLFQIILQDRVLVHICIHCRSDVNRTFRGHNGCGEHIVGDAARDPADDICACRGDEK